jgi:hypothetical protein
MLSLSSIMQKFIVVCILVSFSRAIEASELQQLALPSSGERGIKRNSTGTIRDLPLPRPPVLSLALPSRSARPPDPYQCVGCSRSLNSSTEKESHEDECPQCLERISRDDASHQLVCLGTIFDPFGSAFE